MNNPFSPEQFRGIFVIIANKKEGTDEIEEAINELLAKGVQAEPVRIDPLTGKKFTFFSDPDGLPIELYEK